MLLQETHDPLHLKMWAVEALRHDYEAFPDKFAPCQRACCYCKKCRQALRFTMAQFEYDNSTVYEVWDGDDRKGVIWFLGDGVMHAFFRDHKLLGKAQVLRDAAENHAVRTGRDVTVMVPRNADVVARWLSSNGFRHVRTEDRGFVKYGRNQPITVLEIE